MITGILIGACLMGMVWAIDEWLLCRSLKNSSKVQKGDSLS